MDDRPGDCIPPNLQVASGGHQGGNAETTVVVLRVHHVLSDGLSLVNLIDTITETVDPGYNRR